MLLETKTDTSLRHRLWCALTRKDPRSELDVVADLALANVNQDTAQGLLVARMISCEENDRPALKEEEYGILNLSWPGATFFIWKEDSIIFFSNSLCCGVIATAKRGNFMRLGMSDEDRCLNVLYDLAVDHMALIKEEANRYAIEKRNERLTKEIAALKLPREKRFDGFK